MKIFLKSTVLSYSQYGIDGLVTDIAERVIVRFGELTHSFYNADTLIFVSTGLTAENSQLCKWIKHKKWQNNRQNRPWIHKIIVKIDVTTCTGINGHPLESAISTGLERAAQKWIDPSRARTLLDKINQGSEVSETSLVRAARRILPGYSQIEQPQGKFNALNLRVPGSFGTGGR